MILIFLKWVRKNYGSFWSATRIIKGKSKDILSGKSSHALVTKTGALICPRHQSSPLEFWWAPWPLEREPLDLHMSVSSLQSQGEFSVRLCTFVAPITVGSRHRDKNIRQNTNLCIMGGNAVWLPGVTLGLHSVRTLSQGGLQRPRKSADKSSSLVLLPCFHL